jgi:hypothetical protein
MVLASVHPRLEVPDIYKKSAFYGGQNFLLVVIVNLQLIEITANTRKGATTKCAKKVKNKCL